MAVNKLSAQEFIQNSFSPVIATFCSPLVEQTCKKNNLTFTELLQPFCKLTAEANFRDPSGTLVAIKNLRIVVSDVNSRPPQPTMARKFLNESVSSSCSERNTVVQIGELSLDVPVGVPWFEAWRDTFLQVQFPSDHEFTKHYLACMLVVSSQEISPMDNYIQMASQLQQMQSISPAKLPKWFSPSVLRYYVLLHDNMDGNLSAAETTFELMKNTYGINNCFFLNINSQSESSFNNDSHQPDPWSQFISKQLYSQDINEADINMVDGSNHTDGLGGVEPAQEAGETPTTPVILHPLSPITEPHHLLAVNNIHDKGIVADSLTNCWPSHGARHGAHLSSADLERLRQFINDFCIRCLIPHVETQIQQLTDIISNKKGVSRSLISATKRWFGSNKPGLPNSPTAAVMYLSDSPELQLRRLGDLCFMFGAYSLAFTAYHGAKRDFNADAAWLHYAGALEMAALSLFMQGSDTSRKAHEYAEESILTYLNSCRDIVSQK